jgi:flagellar basal-body rod protein FlgB
MIFGTPPLGLAMAKVALDATALRHQAIAHNIANLHSEDHVPLTVPFEAQLEAARRRLAPPPLEAVPRPGAAAGPRPQDADVEMVALSENTIHYQALLRALGSQLGIVAAAIGDGRRG